LADVQVIARHERRTEAAVAEDWKQDRIEAAKRGENPTVIARMPSGYAVMGDTQFLLGYCVLLATPQVAQLGDLPLAGRRAFLTDMALLGEAVTAACKPAPRRINYEILGNTDPFLHAYLFPRYDTELPEFVRHPVWLYPRDRWSAPEYQFSEASHGAFKARIATKLHELMRQP